MGFLKLRALRQQSLARRINLKLAARIYGPFHIIQRIGSVDYKLQLPSGCRIHPVFHASQLKRAVGNIFVQPNLPDGLEADRGDVYAPEAVLAKRTVSMDGQQVPQNLVQWKDKSVVEATWEDLWMLKDQFPEFRLEDKANVDGGGIDRAHIPEIDEGHTMVNEAGRMTVAGAKDKSTPGVTAREGIWEKYCKPILTGAMRQRPFCRSSLLWAL